MRASESSNPLVDGSGLRIGVVAALFHRELVDKLLAGALSLLGRQGVASELTTIERVPGAFEIPLALRWMSRCGFDALIGLGVVIRGETPHFDYICDSCAHGCQQVALDADVPVAFGVLTCDDLAQAVARCGGAVGNKGEEAAQAALEMAVLRARIAGHRVV